VPTASVMAIRSEVFGSCVGEINVSVEQSNVVVWLCCGLIYMRFILAGKVLKICLAVGNGARYWGSFLVLGVIEEIKTPVVAGA